MKTFTEEQVKELCRKAYEFGNDQAVLDLNMASFEKWWIGQINYTGGHQGRLNIYPPIEDDGSHNRKKLDEEIQQLKWTDEEDANKRMNIIGQNGNDGHHYRETNTQKSFGDEDIDEGEWDDAYWKDAQDNQPFGD